MVVMALIGDITVDDPWRIMMVLAVRLPRGIVVTVPVLTIAVTLAIAAIPANHPVAMIAAAAVITAPPVPATVPAVYPLPVAAPVAVIPPAAVIGALALVRRFGQRCRGTAQQERACQQGCTAQSQYPGEVVSHDDHPLQYSS